MLLIPDGRSNRDVIGERQSVASGRRMFVGVNKLIGKGRFAAGWRNIRGRKFTRGSVGGRRIVKMAVRRRRIVRRGAGRKKLARRGGGKSFGRIS